MSDAVFIHSGFRTGSSWLWAKFRRNEQSLAYGEIFNELLATLDGQAAASLSHSSWNSRHPVTAPYFAEFMPLLNPRGGIEGFSEEMAFNLYFPRGDRLSDDERNYVQRLLDHAADLGKTPVLSCTRTLGRLRQIKRDFGGVHILLTRDPFRQWCSYTEQAALGNPYFLNTNSRILKAAREAGWFHFGGVDHDQQDFLALDDFYSHALLHLKLYGEVAGEADVIIDYASLESETYRQEIRRQILAKCGTEVDLSDFRLSKQFSLVDLPSVAAIDETLQAFLPSRDRMHPHVRALYEAMKSSMKSYANEAAELVRFSRGQHTELQASRAELEGAATESSELRRELEQSAAALAELRGRLESKQAELNDVHKQSAAALAELRGRLESERAERKVVHERVAALGKELNVTAQEREAIRARLAQAEAGLHKTAGLLERALADGQEGRTLLKDSRSALAASARAHLVSVERLSNERRAGEEAVRREFGSKIESLRMAAVKAQVGEAASRGELARLEASARTLQTEVRELRATLQQTLSESERLHRERDAARTEAHATHATLERTRADADQQLHEKQAALTLATAELVQSHANLARAREERAAFMARANALIGAVIAERPDPWQRIGLALGLTRPSPARTALASWTKAPSALAAQSLSDHVTRQPTGPHMPAPPMIQDRDPYLRAETLAELLSWEDVDFVRCAYVTVLGRQPDTEGEAYFTNRLRQGRSKYEILWYLRRSDEGRRHDPGIAGLDRELRRAARARSRLFGWIVRAVSRLPGDSTRERQMRALENAIQRIARDQQNGFAQLRILIESSGSPGNAEPQSRADASAVETAPAQPSVSGLSERAAEIFRAMSSVR